MTTSQFFASSYTIARAKFLAASRDSGARVTHYTLPELRGPEKEELVMDVAQLGETDPGTHGIEGFCGSGCQVGYLVDQLYQALPTKSGVDPGHALNPFGFAWLSRVNEHNFDLNRNFQDFFRLAMNKDNENAGGAQ